MKTLIIAFLLLPSLVYSQNSNVKTKFYDFDDLLINGEYKKPQVLYIDADSKIKFERLLKLKRDLLPKLQNTQRDPSLR
jgi:dephospho-CoA kinase